MIEGRTTNPDGETRSYTALVNRGHLRIYLGAAPGVGKTFAMLDEGFRRNERGTDVVVAYVETHNRPKTEAQIRDLEVVPRKPIEYRGSVLEEMDLDALLARHPQVALVDELAHTNVPGSAHAKRWEDVEAILAAGIDVISTVNVQHLESVNDVVERITGIKQRETIPDSVVRAADQVELVDMAPEALRRRMAHGNIYAADKVDAALGNYFRVGNLSALRELALLWVADKVDDSLQDYMAVHGIDHSWETRERIVVAVTGAPSGEHLIRRASRMATRAKGDLIGVHISASDGLLGAPNALLDQHRQLLADLGGEYHEVIGDDVGRDLMNFARAEHATQLVVGATQRSRSREMLGGSVINRVIRDSGEIDVHVISQPAERRPVTSSSGLSARRRPQVSARRRLAGWLITLIGLPIVLLFLHVFDDSFNLTSDSLVLLLLVVVVAIVGGRGPALAAAVVASLSVNWFFTPPLHTFTIGEPDNLLAFVIFLAVAALISMVVSQATSRSVDALRARAEAEALARVAGGLVGDDDPVLEIVVHLRSTFSLESVAVLVRDGEDWMVEAAAGEPVPTSPDHHDTVPLAEGATLVLVGPTLTADDRRVVQVFAAQLSAARERSRLRREAADAAALADADQLRTAILRAVSHDLRTPLASIKASVTSLLQHDIDWSAGDRDEFLATIDEEADRLNQLVGNLLDMSRLETGALDVQRRAVGLEEVVARSLASISEPTTEVAVDVSEGLPAVLADPALLERAIANLVTNALRFAPDGQPVRIEAAPVGERVDLRVIDRGLGVSPRDRERIFEPFQRLGDSPSGTGTGVGLGLAVAKGFVEAMGGELLLDDTPGGGLTAVIELPRAVA